MIKFVQRHMFTNKNQIWIFWAQISRILAGTIFVVVITRSISPELLATWYIFLATFGLITLGEMGLSTVYGRHFVYIRSDYEVGKHSKAEFANFIKRGERIYFLLALVLFFVAITAGSWALYFKKSNLSEAKTITYWVVYSFGGACSILSMFYGAVINGMGDIWRAQKLSIVAVWVNSAILLLLLLFKDTLIIPVCAFLVSQASALLLYRREVYKYPVMKGEGAMGGEINQIPIDSVRSDTLKTVVGIAAYQGLTNGFFLIISRFFPHGDIAAYGLTIQFYGIVTSLSMVWASTAFYEMAANRGKGKDYETLNIFRASFCRSSIVCLIGVLGIYFLGPAALKILGSRTELFRNADMAVLLCVIWVEFNYGLFAQLLISQGDLRVSYIAALGTIAMCGLTFTLSSFSYSLQQIFWARLGCNFLCFGIPYLILVKKLFSLKLHRIRLNPNETFEYLRSDL